MKNNFLAEKMLASEISKISELRKIVKYYSSNNLFLYQEASKKRLINEKSLFDFLKINNECENIGIYEYMTNRQKWEQLINFENLGELLLRKKQAKIEQLTEVISDLKNNPNINLEDLLLSKSLFNHNDIYDALEFQMNQEILVNSFFDEFIINLPKLKNSQKLTVKY